MYIGILKIKLNIPANQNLKGKRHIIQSLCSRIHKKNAHHIGIAEIADQDLWQIASLGIVCVSNDARHVQKTLAKVVDNIREWEGEYVLMDHQVDILNM